MAFGDYLKQKLVNNDFMSCEQNKMSPNAIWIKLRDAAVNDLKNCYPQKIDSDIAIQTYYSILSEHTDYLPDFVCQILPSNRQERFRVINRNLFSSNAFHPDGLANQVGIAAYKDNNDKCKGEKVVFQWVGTDIVLDDCSKKQVVDSAPASCKCGKLHAYFDVTDSCNAKIINYALDHGLNKRPPTNSKLKEDVIKSYDYTCEYARCTGLNHETPPDQNGNHLMHGHHIIPLKAAKDFLPLNLDRESNIAPVCPNCHDALHRGSLETKIAILKVLYDEHVKRLSDDGIYITFDTLVERYYKPCNKEVIVVKDFNDARDEKDIDADIVGDIIEIVNHLGGHGTYEDILNAVKKSKGKTYYFFNKKHILNIIDANADIFIRTRTNSFNGYRVSLSYLSESNYSNRQRFINENINSLTGVESLAFNVVNAIIRDVFTKEDVLLFGDVIKKVRDDIEDVEEALNEGLSILVSSGFLEKADDTCYKKTYRVA